MLMIVQAEEQMLRDKITLLVVVDDSQNDRVIFRTLRSINDSTYFGHSYVMSERLLIKTGVHMNAQPKTSKNH